MRTITKNVYQFDELTDKAKDKARSWYRACPLDDDWWDSVYDDAETIGLTITSFDLDRNRHAEGKLIDRADVVAGQIIANHGADCDTTKTAKSYLADRKAITDKAEVDDDGEYSLDVDHQLEELDNEFLRSILEDYSIMLQREYEYLMSDESVDEMIRCNEYEFDVSGNRAV